MVQVLPFPSSGASFLHNSFLPTPLFSLHFLSSYPFLHLYQFTAFYSSFLTFSLSPISTFQDDYTVQKWKSLEVKTRVAMGLSGIRAMSEGKSALGNLILDIVFVGQTKLSYSRASESVMDFESDWGKHRNSSAFTAQEIRFTPSFMPWSCRIPINEGFYEFL